MCWEGGLLSSPQVLGQLLRKESRDRRAMKVVLRLWGRRAALGPEVEGLSGQLQRGARGLRGQAETSPGNEEGNVSGEEQLQALRRRASNALGCGRRMDHSCGQSSFLAAICLPV